jgi:ABC-type uncharacterized transport system permease subunit
MPVPHGSNLAVVSPDNQFFFIAFSQPDRSSAYQPLIEDAVFKEMKQLKLVTTKAEGVLGVNVTGQAKRRLIFTKTGRYKVLLSEVGESLETDDPILKGSCEVYYFNKRRSR